MDPSESSDDDEYDPGQVAAVVPSAIPDALDSTEKLAVASCSATVPTSLAAAGTAGPSSPAPLDTYRLYTGMKGRVRCLAVTPSGTVLCAGSEDGQLCMWDFNTTLESRRVLPTRVLTPFVNRIHGLQPIIAVESSKDGAFFVACQDGDAPVLVGSTGKQLGYCAIGERGLLDVVQCKGHRAPVTCTAAHKGDAHRFYTGSQDGTARMWESGSFERKSCYVIKHGSGQLTDTVVVESVCSLEGTGVGGHVFCSGAADGLVQVWDSRVKYRPGGVLHSIDIYKDDPDAFDKHVGGIREIATDTATGLLAVRAGCGMKVVDLRNAAAGAHSTGLNLPSYLDTTVVSLYPNEGEAMNKSGVLCQDRFLTCTSREGLDGHAGGYVVGYRVDPSSGRSAILNECFRWCAGSAEEDVLCVCADTCNARGSVFAGLSTGEVVAKLGDVSSPLARWVNSRPAPQPRDRIIGEKTRRDGDAADSVLEDLF